MHLWFVASHPYSHTANCLSQEYFSLFYTHSTPACGISQIESNMSNILCYWMAWCTSHWNHGLCIQCTMNVLGRHPMRYIFISCFQNIFYVLLSTKIEKNILVVLQFCHLVWHPERVVDQHLNCEDIPCEFVPPTSPDNSLCSSSRFVWKLQFTNSYEKIVSQ